MGRAVVSEIEAQRAALAFLRAKIPNWDAMGFIVTGIDESLPMPGCHVVRWGPRPDHPRGTKIAGNWPVVVDEESGQCRFMAGVDEYFAVRDAAREARGEDPAVRPSGATESDGPV